MRPTSSISLFLVLVLADSGCYRSNKNGHESDAGFGESDSAVLTGGKVDRNPPLSDSGTDETVVNNAPCEPDCPALEWIEIPRGTFLMGSPQGDGFDNEHPQHEVTVQRFRMLKTEVTVSQYSICVAADGCREMDIDDEGMECNWVKPGFENHPINCVDWYQAKAFSEWVGARLPTEAEWEYASRSAGRDIQYPWGDEKMTSCDYAVIQYDESGNDCGNETTMEVCSKPKDKTSQGLCDMGGNILEWVEDDYHDNYSGAPSNAQAWVDHPRGKVRVLRGGSWEHGPGLCRSTNRYSEIDLDFVHYGYGFRLVLDFE